MEILQPFVDGYGKIISLIAVKKVGFMISVTGGRSVISNQDQTVEAACVHISFAVLSFRARKSVQVSDRNYNKFTEGNNMSFCNVFQSVQMC